MSAHLQSTDTQRERGVAHSTTSISTAALPSSDVDATYVSAYVCVWIYVGSGRRVGNFLNTVGQLSIIRGRSRGEACVCLRVCWM